MTACDCALCGSCEEDRLARVGLVVAYIDDDVVGLVADDRPGFFVAPRAHAGTLFDSPEQSAAVLARLTQVAEEVKSLYGVTEARIEPTTDLPEAAGHVCYHVTLDPHGGESPRSPDTQARVQGLAERLRRNAAGLAGRRSDRPAPPV